MPIKIEAPAMIRQVVYQPNASYRPPPRGGATIEPKAKKI